ncbi:cobalt-precorrin-6A reductase [Methylobacterium nodulans]|uniref:Precorrin-6x reductase n=1 Tax=Methylobacterium nodulans (strain LMG 21967 / CNCM I-2342 / ORS 2060) TaxID=460265 RepID=B8IUR9_METNO|nr:cobalt-precorrin-6A reductase [Methylobacterium nodulans]ACL57137.1 precorrin-6x reductase [Methylobacterium nodulans ORS 2060]
MRILLLGGTTEATGLVRRLAEHPSFRPTLSLAGRTAAPVAAPFDTRIGGFGGPEGLARWLEAEGVAAVVDATHPFAQRISHNAAQACARLKLPLVALRRPAWTPQAGDRWHEVESVAAAVPALGVAPRRVFLTVGRLELAAFAAAPQHAYLVRTIEPVGEALPVPDLVAIAARGPFSEADELALMRDHRIEVLVTKNSGGSATYGKIAAARALALPVVIVRQPAPPAVEQVGTLEAALAWLEAHRAASTRRGV